MTVKTFLTHTGRPWTAPRTGPPGPAVAGSTGGSGTAGWCGGAGPVGAGGPGTAAARSGPDGPPARRWSDGLPVEGRLVGTVTGSELLGVSRGRFLLLARAGCLCPARWYVNRYRALVWLYPAEEVVAFAGARPEWLTGRLPEAVRAGLDRGLDLRPGTWRARRTDLLVARAADARQEVAVWFSLLGAERSADLLPDPGERLRMAGERVSLLTGAPAAAAGEEGCPVPLVAQDVAETAHARARLSEALERARPAPSASADPPRAPGPAAPTTRRPPRSGRLRRILGRPDRDRRPEHPPRRRHRARPVRPGGWRGRP